MNPYRNPKQGMLCSPVAIEFFDAQQILVLTQDAVRNKLAEQEAQAEAVNNAYLLHEDVSGGQLIMMGIGLEAAQ